MPHSFCINSQVLNVGKSLSTVSYSLLLQVRKYVSRSYEINRFDSSGIFYAAGYSALSLVLRRRTWCLLQYPSPSGCLYLWLRFDSFKVQFGALYWSILQLIEVGADSSYLQTY